MNSIEYSPSKRNASPEEEQPQDGAEQDDLGDAHVPLEEQHQVQDADGDGRQADGGADDVVGLAEGEDDSRQQADAHGAHAGENLLHAAAFLKLDEKHRHQGGHGEGGGENPQVGGDGAWDAGGVDAGEGGAV